MSIEFITDFDLLINLRKKLFSNLDSAIPWEDYNPNEIDFFEECIPDDAIYATEFIDQVENVMTTWRLESTYYVCKVPERDNQFVLFDIAWDDNNGTYEINAIVGIKGCKNHEEAKPLLLEKFGQDNLAHAGGGEYEIFLRTLCRK